MTATYTKVNKKQLKKRDTWCPMEAQTIKSSAELEQFPYIAMPKYDGVRCIMKEGLAISKLGNRVRNLKLRELLENHLPKGFEFEGEMMCYHLDGTVMRFPDIISITAAFNPTTPYIFKYHIWDIILHDTFEMRLKQLKRLEPELPDWAVVVPYEEINSREEADEYKKRMIKHTPEGIILRKKDSPYKYGRSKGQENWYIKWKCRDDADGIVTGYTQYFKNTAVSKKNKVGYSKKTTKKEDMQALERIGGLYIKSPEFEKEALIGTGFTNEQREEYWLKREEIIGQTVVFEHDGQNGEGLPKNPSFKGFRND